MGIHMLKLNANLLILLFSINELIILYNKLINDRQPKKNKAFT